MCNPVTSLHEQTRREDTRMELKPFPTDGATAESPCSGARCFIRSARSHTHHQENRALSRHPMRWQGTYSQIPDPLGHFPNPVRARSTPPLPAPIHRQAAWSPSYSSSPRGALLVTCRGAELSPPWYSLQPGPGRAGGWFWAATSRAGFR